MDHVRSVGYVMVLPVVVRFQVWVVRAQVRPL